MLGATMRTALAAVLVLLIAPPADAAFAVCNRTPHETMVALGRFDGTAWSSQGWWTVAPGTCQTLLGSPLDARYYYLYATDGGAGSWDGKKGFCVTGWGKFTIRGRAGCEAHGYERKGFFEIDTGEARDYVQTLAD
jgi:uncharacterized membrane protein